MEVNSFAPMNYWRYLWLKADNRASLRFTAGTSCYFINAIICDDFRGMIQHIVHKLFFRFDFTKKSGYNDRIMEKYGR